MESYKIENLSFTYPDSKKKALDDINLTVSQGEFITICGKSGCGKTTLLRLLKSSLSPFGNLCGNIYFNNKPILETDQRQQASQIGFVMQSPDNQIVADKVWHELAFGLESLGYSTPEIRTRVSEMASFFGIENWFYKKVTELSGGQKQLLNLASVMVMQPSVLILDEPTSQLDPIAAHEFIKTLERINRELGTTVILTEHRLEDAFSISDRVVVMDEGRIIADEEPCKVGEILKSINHDMYLALPAPMRVYSEIENGARCPLTVRDGRKWLEKYSQNHNLNADIIPKPCFQSHNEDAKIVLKDVWFRYEKDLPDVIKGLNTKIYKGEIFSIVGGNGTGKTTALSLISGLNTPYRGEVLINGKKLSQIHNLYNGILGVLPQNPQALFVKNTVYLDLLEMVSEQKISKADKDEQIKNVAKVCCIEDLLKCHPCDLSGGEQQRAALAKVLLLSPEILLLDEPTKGMDAHFKKIFAGILKNLKSNGITIIMVSHDIEFCAEYADRCALFFDGNITSVGQAREFFAGKSFYTTSANRMARTTLSNAVLAEDIILACGGEALKYDDKKLIDFRLPDKANEYIVNTTDKKKITLKRIIAGSIFAILFVLACITQHSDIAQIDKQIIQLISIIEAAICLACFIPQKQFGTEIVQQSKDRRKPAKRTIIPVLFALIAVPLTIFFGTFYLQDRKYYFISLLIILETIIPFCMAFEKRKPAARELIVISVLCAIAVAGRTIFNTLPQFKPVVALVIIAGVCFGAESGFLVGVVTGFVSNFFLGQGAWTPWQMFSLGLIGFIAGILFAKGFLKKTKLSLCIFGGLATLIIYGIIMNASSAIMFEENLSFDLIASYCILGLPFDLIHTVSTIFFLWFISGPMIDKLERIKSKYGLMGK